MVMQVMTIILMLWLPVGVMAWNPFASDDFEEVLLTKTELLKVKLNAGWAKGDDQTLIFELINGLKAPIQCGSANVELNDGKTIGKQFVPKFAIPANASRNASMTVLKGTMKTYALSCSCFKKKGSELCVNPLKSS
ncbi:MAG: hypothetical protein RL462_89 [Pseudomonadota bacterium]|jgi:hypothetical protein